MSIYYEIVNDINSALQREKVIKHWKREWKIQLIEKQNSTWNDLSLDIQ
jgi:putative endonuclease